MTDAQRDQVARAATERFRLTPAIARLLRALLDGVPRAYVARELGLSENTVATEVRVLLRAMACATVAEAVWLLRGWPAPSAITA